MLRQSYSAAEVVPVKLIKDTALVRTIQDTKKIPPHHVQFIPTNKCNLNCSFCSCHKEDKSLEMPLPMAADIIEELADLGMQAVTITGGGEPLLYPDFEELIGCFSDVFVEVGLVTNGMLLHKVSKRALYELTWCRISHSDNRPFNKEYADRLKNIINELTVVDWAFSYVATKRINYDNIVKVIEFVNEVQATHLRVVADILNYKDVTPFDILKRCLEMDGIDISRVIFQSRNKPTKGSKRCWVSYLRPVIAPSGNVYACCGAQYAIKKKTGYMPDELCLGKVDDLFSKSVPFDGSICDICYYTGYNAILDALIKETKHEAFV